MYSQFKKKTEGNAHLHEHVAFSALYILIKPPYLS